jgi:M6 family metalloprotease-like protein
MSTALVFVDFPDTSTKKNPTALAKKLTNGEKASKWFQKQSFGKMTMDFVIPVAEWRTMSKSVKSYHCNTGDSHRDFIQEALNLFPKTDFTKYDYVVVIPANTKRHNIGTACYSHYKVDEDNIKTKHGSVNLAITFGDCDFNSLTYYTLIHELGHCLSLPDTYDVSIRDLSHRAVAGAWDLMCDTGCGVNYLGWHRHHLGWLANNRKHFMKDKKVLETVLTPLSEEKGLSMIAIPVNDAKNPSKVFVVELALPIRQTGKDLQPGKNYGEGLLVYSVDSRIQTGRRPLVVYPKSTEYSKVYSYTYKAPFLVGDTFEHKDAPMKVEVIGQEGKNYKIRIIKK